ncbi:hypothetical protein [Sinorhizobium medicae]
MTKIEVKALVPTGRLDQLIGSVDPTSAEIHDMAVELILWRRSGLADKATAGEVERLCKALQKIAEDTRRCDHDLGFDREIGPLGCSLGDKCVCLHIHMTAAAAIRQRVEEEGR